MFRILVVAVMLTASLFVYSIKPSVTTHFAETFSKLSTGIYECESSQAAEYLTVIYNGREYALYGSSDKNLKKNQIKECIGYTGDDTRNKLYSLTDSDDFIAQYYDDGTADQFYFYRALDTIGEVVATPDYIESFGYDIWTLF